MGVRDRPGSSGTDGFLGRGRTPACLNDGVVSAASSPPAGERGSSGPPPGAGRAARHRRGRAGRRRLIVMLFAVFLAGFTALTLRLFVFPAADVPVQADAIVMLAGPGDRTGKAIELARTGYAPVLVMSTPGTRGCSAHEAPKAEVICFSPHPVTTRGEARAVAELAARHGWTRILFVTGRAQDTRARIRISRCFHGDLRVTVVGPRRLREWPYAIAYEWGALAKALIWQRSC